MAIASEAPDIISAGRQPNSPRRAARVATHGTETEVTIAYTNN